MRKHNLIICICALCCAGVYVFANSGQTETVEITKQCLGDVGNNTGVCTKEKKGVGSYCSDEDTNANKDCNATYVVKTTTETSVISNPG